MINEIELITGASNSSLNGIFRGKNLGTISNLNEYLAFRTAHGIDTKEYKDLYLGDYFKINDGTYNTEWMVAHFDYYYFRGDYSVASNRGVVLIPRTTCGESKMNNTNTAEGGYAATIVNTTVCPAIATALQTVLGSYLLSNSLLISNTITASMPSMAGANWQGASTSWTWTTTQCVLPNEVQIFGSTVLSSSFYDIGEACEKLAVFNFINHVEYSRSSFWMRAVSSSTNFVRAGGSGNVDGFGAFNSQPIRPIIYIG